MNRHVTSRLPIRKTVAYRMYRSSRLIRHLHYLTFQRNGVDLSPEQWFILNKLSERSPQSQTELGEPLIDDRPNMTRLLAALEQKGFIIRRTDEKDRRRTEVTLTENGRALLDEGLPPALAVREQMRQGITEEEWQQFWSVLDKLDTNLTAMIHQSQPNEENGR